MWTDIINAIARLPENSLICEIKIDESIWKGYNIKELFELKSSERIVFLGKDGQMAAVSAGEVSLSKAYLMFEKDGRRIYDRTDMFRLVFPEEKYHRRWCREITKYRIQGE